MNHMTRCLSSVLLALMNNEAYWRLQSSASTRSGPVKQCPFLPLPPLGQIGPSCEEWIFDGVLNKPPNISLLDEHYLTAARRWQTYPRARWRRRSSRCQRKRSQTEGLLRASHSDPKKKKNRVGRGKQHKRRVLFCRKNFIYYIFHVAHQASGRTTVT